MKTEKKNSGKSGEIDVEIAPTEFTDPVFTRENSYRYSHIRKDPNFNSACSGIANIPAGTAPAPRSPHDPGLPTLSPTPSGLGFLSDLTPPLGRPASTCATATL